MNSIRNMLLLPLLAAALACGEDEAPSGSSNGNTPPTIPALGTMMDRVGRPAVSTALIAPLAAEPMKGTMKDSYNEAMPSSWAGFADEIAASLAIYDALDTVCGNQVLAGADAVAGRYDTLAGALADDRLYVNSAASACGQYLAVELDATGVAPNDDCGGRTPGYDVIDVTYSALAIGAVSGVGDGVSGDDAQQSGDTFPFLAAP